MFHRFIHLILIINMLLISVLLIGSNSIENNSRINKKFKIQNGNIQNDMVINEHTTFRTLYSTEVSSLNYLVVGSQHEQQIGANVIDTLVSYDQYGTIKPALAMYWRCSDDGLIWTFYLKDGLKWVNYKGEEVAHVTAEDFVSAAKYVLSSENGSVTAQSYFGVIENAKEYYYGKETDFSNVGVKAIDKTTLQYTLEKPIPYFLSTLTYVCYMPAYGPLLDELGTAFATDNKMMYYNGAYRLSTFDPQVKHIYTKNNSYWDSEHVYISKIEERYNQEANTLGPVLVQRGEIDQAKISADILDEWLSTKKTRNMVSKRRLNTGYSYFYCFNFNPKFDQKYEPDNWRIAVNNEDFRKALMASFDRVRAISVNDPNEPKSILNNTITPRNFCDINGIDYTMLEELKNLSELDSFDGNMALEYKEKAMNQLNLEGVIFPIKILMPYNPVISNWNLECIVVEQQMEGLLGKDFIDIIVEAGPPSNFLSKVRRAGNYAFMKCSWGADYADPETWSEPFIGDFKFSFFENVVKENTKATPLINEYYKLVESAIIQNVDMGKRFKAFAKAEAFLIKHALVVPYSISGNEYIVTRLNVFEGEYAPYGISTLKYKGHHIFRNPISMSEYNKSKEIWNRGRKEELKK